MIKVANAAIALGLLLSGGFAVFAQTSPGEQRGQTLVRTNCSRCHATDKVSASPLTIAPPFRELHKRYPIEDLQESLVEGIRTGHDNMPEFRFDVGQAADILAYLKSLER